jgi:hypothetical protein
VEDLPASERIYFQPLIEFSQPVAVAVKAHTFLTPIEISSATPIARYKDITVAAMRKLGQGQVYYFGTNLGASIEDGDKNGIELLRAIVRQAVQPMVTSEKVRPRLIEGGSRSLLAVFNDTTHDQAASIILPQKYVRVTDIYEQRELPVDQHTVRVTVPYQNAVVLRLE